MYFIRFCFLLVIFLPTLAHAQFSITEIMYDAEGTDTGNEWVEVKNTSNQEHDFSKWYFRENEVDHRLTSFGSELIQPGEYAIIISNQENFEAAFGANHQLFKSSFSLNNTGELIALSNPEKELVTQYLYSSDSGAAGDGNSLQYNGTTFVSRSPSPSEDINNQQEQTNTTESGTTSKTTSTRSQEKEFIPYYEAHIQVDETILAGNQTTIRPLVYHHKEREVSHVKIRGVYLLNMGDGTQHIYDERMEFDHIYQSPGTYIQSLAFYSSSFRYEQQEQPTLIYTQLITVYQPDVSISANEFGGLEIANMQNHPLDVSGWKITHPLGSFEFPSYSYITQKASISIPYHILGAYVTSEIIHDIDIWNHDNYSVVAKEEVQEPIQKIEKVEEVIVREEVTLPEAKDEDTNQYPFIVGFIISTLIIAGVRYYKKNIEKEPIG